MYILVEVADREICVLQFDTLKEAQGSMFEALRETLGCIDPMEDTEDLMSTIMSEIDKNGDYQDDYCGMSMFGGWYNRNHGSTLDWSIEEIKIDKRVEETVGDYQGRLADIMEFKAAVDEPDEGDDRREYYHGFADGLREAARAIRKSGFMYKKY